MSQNDPLDAFCGSVFWNEASYNSSRLPNVTPCFQYTVLAWTPALFFWLLSPAFAFQIYTSFNTKRFRSLPYGPLLILKIFLNIVLFLSSLGLCVKYFLSSDVGAVHFWYPFIRALTVAGLLISQIACRRAGLVSSGIVFNSVLLQLICGLPELYNWLDRMGGYYDGFDGIYDGWRFALFWLWFIPVVGLNLALCFADQRDSDEKGSEEEGRSPELDSSFLNRILLWWFNRVPILGAKKDLEISDLFELNRESKSDFLMSLWEYYWNPKMEAYYEKKRQILADGTHTTLLTNQTKTNGMNGESENANGKNTMSSRDKPKISQPSVVYNLFQMFKWQLISAGAIKFAADILQFANPFLLKKLLEFVSNVNAPLWEGIGYALLMFFGSELRSLMVNYYFYVMFRMGAKIQVALTAAVYKKTLKLSSTSRRDRTVGEIVNVMSIDVERFQMITSQIQQYWSSPFQITLALILLFQTLGIAALPGVFVMVIFIPMSLGASFLSRKYQMRQMKLKDERTKMINEVLNGIKVVKLYAWEVPMQEAVEKIRVEELRCNAMCNLIRSCLDVFNFSTPFLVALCSFTTYTLVDSSQTLTPQVAFVALTLFNQLRSPMTMIGLLINMTVQAIVSNRRLKDLLSADEVDLTTVDRPPFSPDSNEDVIRMKSADFSWEGEGHPPNLAEMNITVPKASLVAVVGSVGSGKSSLLSALLGEMEKIKGYVGMSGRAAYVPQQAWIQNMSLKDNITFGQPFNRGFYNKVIDVCALKSDLAILQRGDMTEIGEKGINLSGGQKARVSLARSVYQNADVYLLDDPLSAVDSHVGKHIFDQVIGPKGILRHKTRILVTHGVTFLKDVDMIVHIDDGRILETGTFSELMASDPKFAELVAEAEKGRDNGSHRSSASLNAMNATPRTVDDSFDHYDEAHISIMESSDLDSPTNLNRQMSTVSTLAHRRSGTLSKSMSPPLSPNGKTKSADVESKGKDKLIQDESIQTGRVNAKVYLIYMKAASAIFSLLFIFLYFAYSAIQVGRNMWLSEWSDANDEAKSKGDPVPLGTRLGVYAFLGFMETASFALALVFLVFGSLRASRNLHGPMLNRILHAPMAFFDTTPIGRILNRFGKDVDLIDTMLPMNFRYFLMCMTNVASTIIIICISTPAFIVVAILLIFIYYYALRFYVPTSRQLRRLESINRSPIYSHFSESIQGVSTIRAFGKTDSFCQISNNHVDTFIQIKYLSLVSNRWLGIRLELLGNLVTFFAALFAALSNQFGFVASAGLVGLSVSYALNITETMNFAVRQVSELETNIVSVERLKEYSEVETEAEWVNESNRPPSNWPDRGSVTIEKYATRYRPGLDLVVKDINAVVAPSEKIGIVGRTGAGKSSLTLALFRMVEPAEGRIVIDGIDVTKIGLHDLRSHITIIPQEPVLFSGSLRFNLDPFSHYTDDQLWTALEHAHLKGFASSLPEGLNHKISEGGDNISVGQRQLVCLARALLRHTKILVLDEATAAVDVATDALIQETIRREFADSTVFTIAHRLNTILDYDRVLVLSDGQVQEFASPQELLANPNSIFASMVADANLTVGSPNT